MRDIYTLKKYSSKPTIGIYFLWDLDALVYIGQSTDIHKRISEHRVDKKFTYFSYITCPIKKLADLEKAYIQTYNPTLNRTFTKKVQVANDITEATLKDNELRLYPTYIIFRLEDKVERVSIIKVHKNYQFVGYKGTLKPNAFSQGTYYGDIFFKGCYYYILYDNSTKRYYLKH